MNEEERQEKLKEAEWLMKPGYFQHAVRIYESLSMKDKANEARLACANDCLDTKRYALAIHFFRECGREDLAKTVEKICNSQGRKPSLREETYPECMKKYKPK